MASGRIATHAVRLVLLLSLLLPPAIFGVRRDADTLLRDLSDESVSANELNSRRFYENFPNQRNCFLTGVKPEKPRSLSFCHKFNDEACCAPADDDEANEMFATMFDLGLSCRLRGDVRAHPLAKLYCMNCDPEQPQYVRNSVYPKGADATGFENSPTTEREQTILVCEEWMREQFFDSDDNELFADFERCGILVSTPCKGDNEAALDGRDRYTCGDDVVRPQSTFLQRENGSYASEIDSYEAFLNLDSLGTPQLDESFGFLVVKNENCGSVPSNSTNNYAVAPRCLMSPTQQALFYGTDTEAACSGDAYALENPEKCASYVQEKCFNAANSLTPSLLLLAALALISLWFS